jgi:hypothetical protein
MYVLLVMVNNIIPINNTAHRTTGTLEGVWISFMYYRENSIMANAFPLESGLFCANKG